MNQKQLEGRKSNPDLKQSYIINKMRDNCSSPNKNQSNPEYLFFESLKNVFDDSTFKVLIKLLHLYNEVNGNINIRVF